MRVNSHANAGQRAWVERLARDISLAKRFSRKGALLDEGIFRSTPAIAGRDAVGSVFGELRILVDDEDEP